MIDRVQHIGIAVHSIESARRLYEEVLGLEVSGTSELPERGVRAAMVDGHNLTLELLSSLLGRNLLWSVSWINGEKEYTILRSGLKTSMLL
jgi:hypothetical protein